MCKCARKTVLPREVERTAPLYWLRSSLQAVWKAPDLWLVYSLLLYAAMWFSEASPVLSKLAILSFVFLGIRLALATRTAPAENRWVVARSALGEGVGFAGAAALAIVGLQFLLSSIGPLIAMDWTVLSREFFRPEFAWWLNDRWKGWETFMPSALGFFFLWVMVIGSVWLVYPLMSQSGYSLRQACKKNVEAMQSNLSVFGWVVVGMSVLSSTVIVIAPVLAPLLYLLISLFSSEAFSNLYEEDTAAS